MWFGEARNGMKWRGAARSGVGWQGLMISALEASASSAGLL